MKLPVELKGAFDRIICDPPFLSEDCQTKGRFLVTAQRQALGKVKCWADIVRSCVDGAVFGQGVDWGGCTAVDGLHWGAYGGTYSEALFQGWDEDNDV